MGMPGMHGMYWNNRAISEADLVIGIGMRFDDRVTGRLKDFAPRRRSSTWISTRRKSARTCAPPLALQGDVKGSLRRP